MGRVDVAVVGGGVVGLGFALAAARRGRTVAVFERSPHGAEGASVRNFGMVWLVGQPAGELYASASHSRRLWLALARDAGVGVRESGSVHLAYHDDEAAVLREFAARGAPAGVACEYLDAAAARDRYPPANPAGLVGALHSHAELALDPPQAIRALTRHLADTHGVRVCHGRAAVGVDGTRLALADGETVHAGRVFVCAGSDAQTLFPRVLADAGVRRCKLQMLATVPQPGGWRLGPHAAGGLTLLHYPGFHGCPSLPVLHARLTAELPDALALGIHVMAAQNPAGEIILGDSHEYDDAITPFLRDDIDAHILRTARGLLNLPDWTIARRWSGTYLKHPTRPYLVDEVHAGCVVAAAFGGAGMTLALAVAEEWWAARD